MTNQHTATRFIAISCAIVCSMLGEAGVLAMPAPLKLAQQKSEQKRKKDTSIEPTHEGKVIGQVYDAVSGKPITDATVSYRKNGKFNTDAKEARKTDECGKYECKALIGRLSENFDVGRALSTSIVGLLMGGGTNKTKRIDVTRLQVHIERDGYKTFEGVVPARQSDPEKFTLVMHPVLLAPNASEELSSVAEGWGAARIKEVSIEPAVIPPGEKAIVTVKLESPEWNKKSKVRAYASFSLDGKSQFVDLKTPKDDTAEPTLRGELKIGKNCKPQASVLTAVIYEFPYDFRTDGQRGRALVQVADAAGDTDLPKLRERGLRLLDMDERSQAAEAFKKVCEKPGATHWDHLQLTILSRELHDSPTQLMAAKRAHEMATGMNEVMRLMSHVLYIQALVANGANQQAIDEASPLIDKVKEKDRPARLPSALLVAVGEAKLASGQVSEARDIVRQLDQWPEVLRSINAGDFASSVRLREAKDALAATPNGPEALAAYGRVLMDRQSWEEAIEPLQKSLDAKADQPATRRDLVYCLQHAANATVATPNDLEEAILTAEKELEVVDPKGKKAKSKNFHAWHTIGVLLYAKSIGMGVDPQAKVVLERSREMLREALRCGRSGASVSSGMAFYRLGYTSPSVVAIAAFAYPEAASDFVLLEALDQLEDSPSDYLALFNLGSALIDLGHARLARSPIARCLELAPTFLEAIYANALIELQFGDRSKAIQLMKEVIARNPRHPKANLQLAKVYEEDGQTALAAACLAAHSRYFGKARSIELVDISD